VTRISSGPSALVLGLVHGGVDAACAYVLFRDLGGSPLSDVAVALWITLYDILAFVGQAPLGLLVDRLRRERLAAMGGVVMVAVALALAPFSPVGAAVTAGLGNAAFHVGAGAHILRVSGLRAGPVGLFVGPGAVGLALGIVSGQSDLPLRMPLLLGLAAGALCVGRLVERAPLDQRESGRQPWTPALALALGLVFLTVISRALLGDTLAVVAREHSTGLVVALAVAACMGKGTGGLLGDRLGWKMMAAVALAVSVPFLILAPRAPLATLGAGLLVQSTMPLTLKAVHNAMPEQPGFAFGVVSTVLLLGSLPGLARLTLLTSPVLVGTAAVASAVALVVGLHVMHRQGLSVAFPSTSDCGD
jgi:hypothetical protein